MVEQMKHLEEVKFKEQNGVRFYYLDMGLEYHNKPSFRLWVSSKFIKKKDDREYVEFPVTNAKIIRTERGNLVLRPFEGYCVHYIHVSCGYRGDAEFQIEQPSDVEVFQFKEYKSPTGRLGVSVGALINAPMGARIVYKWKKTGRLYGNPAEGRNIVEPDGEERSLPELSPDELELLM